MKIPPSDGIRDALAMADHCVPANAIVCDNKICQACGQNFLRVRGSEDRYCRRCHAKPTLVAPRATTIH
jgi:hypothetical protein